MDKIFGKSAKCRSCSIDVSGRAEDARDIWQKDGTALMHVTRTDKSLMLTVGPSNHGSNCM
jgi:hypothetical protein